MVIVYIVCLCYLLGLSVCQPVSTCRDLDETACTLFASAKPDICSDPSFSQSTCQRFCGNCPLECYNCPSPILDPYDCNTTTTCAKGQTCVTKHLAASDGHDEYILICESQTLCDGSGFGFGALVGKRDDEEAWLDDVDDLDRYSRDVSFSCCDTDFCNFPITTTTAAPTSPGPFPNGCSRDIVFLLDDSGSVGLINFRHSINFTAHIIQQLDIGPTKAMTAVIPFSTKPQVAWYLNTYDTKLKTLNALAHVAYNGGTTHTNEALEFVRSTILTTAEGDRPAAENVVIVVSDGRSNSKVDTVSEANLLHTVSKDVISIVIGSGIDVAELNAIATDNHHVFDVRSYGNLLAILPQLMDIICNA